MDGEDEFTGQLAWLTTWVGDPGVISFGRSKGGKALWGVSFAVRGMNILGLTCSSVVCIYSLL